MDCSIAPPRDHSWVHLEKHRASERSKTCKGCVLREPWIQQALSSPPSRFWEEGCFPHFDASGTVTVGPGSWALMSKGGSPGSGSNKWVCSAGNSWSGLASLEPEASRKPAFPVRGSQPLSGSLGEGRALSSVLTQNSVGLGSQQKEVRLHWARLLFPSSLAGAWERGKEFGVQIPVLARSDGGPGQSHFLFPLC